MRSSATTICSATPLFRWSSQSSRQRLRQRGASCHCAGANTSNRLHPSVGRLVCEPAARHGPSHRDCFIDYWPYFFVLLYTAFNSVTLAALIIANVPFAMVGGVLALLLTGQYLSVPSAICHRLHRRLRGRDAQRHRACVVHQRPT